MRAAAPHLRMRGNPGRPRATTDCAALAVLALLSLLVTTLAYLAQPAFRLDLGGGYDAPYLNTYDLAYIDNWAGGWGDAVHLAPGAEVATTSDQEVSGSSALPPLPAKRPQYGPEAVRENYRWTRARAILLLPGVGGAASLQLRAAASPAVPQGQHVALLVNGQPLAAFDLRAGTPQEQTFDLGASDLGNFTVEMRVTPRGPVDPKSKAPKEGFKLYTAVIMPRLAGAGWTLPFPVWAALLVAALGFYWCLVYVGLARLWAVAAVAAGLLAAGGVLASPWRLALTIFTGRLALLVGLAAVLLPLLDWGLRRLFQRGDLLPPRPLWQGLLALFLAGWLLRGGGVLYPQTQVIDAAAHLVEIWRVTQGQLLVQYTNHVLSQAPGHWHSALVIPYSTISYFLLAPFALLPGDIHVSINLVNVFLDAVRVFVIFGLARGLGAGAHAALGAAGLYLLLPCTWLLNSWGNWPTTISLWLAVLFLALALGNVARLPQRQVWGGLVALLTLTMLVYSVTAVFMILVVGLWAAGLALVAGRRDPGLRRAGHALALMTVVAAGAAGLLYYWQFLPDMLAALSIFGGTVTDGGALGLRPVPFFTYLGAYLTRLFVSYGVGLLLLVSAARWVGAWRAGRQQPADHPAAAPADPAGVTVQPAACWLVGAWLAVFLMFSLIGWRVDMVDKQVWFVVPLACALGGMAGTWAIRQVQQPTLQWTGRLAVAGLAVWLTYSSATLWIYRIFIKRHV